MAEDIAYRMCKAEATVDNDLRREIGRNLIQDLMMDKQGKSLPKPSRGEPRYYNRDGVEELVQDLYGKFDMTATAHCYDEFREKFQVHYSYDESGHFKQMSTSASTSDR